MSIELVISAHPDETARASAAALDRSVFIFQLPPMKGTRVVIGDSSSAQSKSHKMPRTMQTDLTAVYGTGMRCGKRCALYAVAPAVIVLLLGVYLVSPGFYLEHVLHLLRRELQAVEIATFVCAFAGAASILVAAWRHHRMNRGDLSPRGPAGATAIMALIGLAALFFAGEEINYGQTWFGSDVEGDMQGIVNDINLHNHFELFSIQSAGSLFLIIMFLLLPLAWRFRSRTNVPAAWRPAIAEGPVAWTIFLAFAWKEVKNLYRRFVDVPDEPPDPHFYWEFLEQVNEQKELLVAVGLLMYGILRLGAVKQAMHREPMVE
jgi:hypothetical protein